MQHLNASQTASASACTVYSGQKKPMQYHLGEDNFDHPQFVISSGSWNLLLGMKL